MSSITEIIIENVSMITTIALFALGGVFTVLWYFFRSIVENFKKSVDKLSDAVNGLELVVARIDSNVSSHEKRCDAIDGRIDKLYQIAESHSREIAQMVTKCKVVHGD